MSRGQKPNQPKRMRKPAETDEKLQARLEYGKINESPYFDLVYLVKLAVELRDAFKDMTEAQSLVQNTVEAVSKKLVASVFAAVKTGDDTFFQEFGKILRALRERGANADDPVGVTIRRAIPRNSRRLSTCKKSWF